MIRVIGVIIFALIVLGLAGHLFYKNKNRDETSHFQAQWQHHLASREFTAPVYASAVYS
mgnify:FL=1